LKIKKNLIFYGQPDCGVVQLMRSLALAAEMSSQFRVVFLSADKVSRVLRPKNVEFIQLPAVAVRSQEDIAKQSVRRALKRRLARTMEVFRKLRPAVLIIESFPFGKLQFASELLPLLEASREVKSGRPLVLCALQEIETKKRLQIYDDLACILCNLLFDGVLVHSDPRFGRLEDSFHPTMPLSIPVHYSGFIVPQEFDTDGARKGAAIVSMLQESTGRSKLR
jgi:predicted glycosyltransferase